MADNLTGSAGIASSAALGTGGKLAVSLTGRTGIATSSALGVGALMVSGATLAARPKYRVYIAGVDKTSLVQPGIRIHADIGSRSTADFTIIDTAGSYRAALHAEVVIWDHSGSGSPVKIFGGLVMSTVESFYPGGSTILYQEIHVSDYGILCDYRIVGFHYDPGSAGVTGAGLATTMIRDIITRFLGGTGIVFAYTGEPGHAYGDIVFNWVTATETFNQILNEVNWDWRIDYNKTMYIFPKSSGFGSAPVNLADNDGNWKNMRVEKTAARKRNRQGLKNSQNVGALWTDPFVGDGTRTFYPASVTLQYKPVVKVNGTAKVVTDQGSFQQPYDFYWTPSGVWQNPNQTPYTGSDTIQILYPSKLSYVYWTEDSADIAANGKFEAMDEVKDIIGLTELQDLAAGYLSRGKTEPSVITFQSRVRGWEPGQILTINTTKPLVNSATFLIESVDSEEDESMEFFWHSIKCSNQQLQRTSSGAHMFQELIRRDKEPIDRVLERITFVLAQDIEGLTNPGLSTGAKEAVRVAQKDGVLRQCTLYFKSSATTLTTSAISIDVLRNGTSIFSGTNRASYPAGATTVQVQFQFASNPYEIKQNDVFTINVISADGAAKNGTLELTIYG